MVRSKDYVKCFSRGNSVFSCSPDMINVCGGNVYWAVILCKLLFWAGKGKCRGGSYGWFYKSYTELERETGIGLRTIERACAWMKARGFLETKVRKINGVRTMHFRIDFTIFRIRLVEMNGADKPEIGVNKINF